MTSENSVEELTFSYVFDCLHESADGRRFLGFTLSPEYSEVIRSKADGLAKLRNCFDAEVLKAIPVYRVPRQKEPVIKWTDEAEMQSYLKLHGAP